MSRTAIWRLSDPDAAGQLLTASAVVDTLPSYTARMWDILRDVILEERWGIRMPVRLDPIDKPTQLPIGVRLLMYLNRHDARALRSDIRARYHPNREFTIFDSYSLQVAHAAQREHEGFDFLARQADHFEDADQYLVIIHTLYGADFVPDFA